MKRFCFWMTILLAVSTVCSAAESPNILIILADDMGYSDLGCMGGDIETPHLDALAKNGILFPNFYNNAKCAPSRASLMTGQSNHRTGATHGAGDVTRGGMTIAEALKGPYTTLMVDKWHIKPEALELGFDRYFGSPLSAVHWWPTDEKDASKMKLDGRSYTEADMTVPMEEWFLPKEDTNYAIKFLQEEVVNKGKQKPFFMYYGSHAPHWPLQAPREDVARYLETYKDGSDAARQRRYDRMVERGIIDPKTCSLVPLGEKTPTWDSLSEEEKDYYRLALAIHSAMVYRMDQELGRLFGYLKKNRLFDNTVIFFLSDNGASAEGNPTIIPPGRKMGDRGTHSRLNDLGASVCNTPMRGHKSSLYEGGIGTPMIFHWPDGIGTPGKIFNQVGHLWDIFPTVLDIAGMDYPSEFDGRKLNLLDGQSLLPQIKSGTEIDRTLCWDYAKFTHYELFDAFREQGKQLGLFHEAAGMKVYGWNKQPNQPAGHSNDGRFFTAALVAGGWHEGSFKPIELGGMDFERMVVGRKSYRISSGNIVAHKEPPTLDAVKSALAMTTAYGFACPVQIQYFYTTDHPGYREDYSWISKPEHRALWDKYEPANLAIRLAGWEPVTHAWSSSGQVQLQRFGRGDEIYLTVWGSEPPATVDIEVDAAALGLKAKPTFTEIVSDVEMKVSKSSRGWKLTIPLEKNMTRVIRVD